MRKSSRKFVFLTLGSLSFSTVLLLCACLETPSLKDFLKDGDVKKKMESTRVNLSGSSDSGLIAGNKRISNLNRNRYYMIKIETNEEIISEDEEEETEIADAVTGFGFINKDGKVILTTEQKSLQNIGKVTGGEIIGLYNARTDSDGTTPAFFTKYTVKSATNLTNQMHYYENLSKVEDINEHSPRKPFPSNGTIAAPDKDKYHFLDLGSFIKEDHDYDFFIPDPNPDDEIFTVGYLTGNIVQMSRSYNTADYIFVEYDEDEQITNFRLLTVHLRGETQPDGTTLDITVTYSMPDELQITYTPGNNEYSQSGSISDILFEVTNAGLYDNIEWYVDIYDPATPTETGPSFLMEFADNIDYQIIGIYRIYVIAKLKSDGRYCEAVIDINVSA